METKPITKHINRLLLDPNNYRFIDRSDYKVVAEEEISEVRIQQRTSLFLAGKNNENIEDLINSFMTNGILKQDPIQVKAFKDDYIVIEGNRRTATLKYLYDRFKQGYDVGVLSESDFKSIDVIEHQNDDPKLELIAMGIHHISGKKRWSPINQTRLIQDLLEKHEMTEESVCNALGITKHNLRRSMRTLALIERYKNSDFGDQFETNKYSIFEEIIKKTELKNWLEWDDVYRKPMNSINEDRLYSWISREEQTERDEETGEEQLVTLDPIITKSHEIREIAKFINDSKAIEKMEECRSITEGFAFSDAIGETRLHNAIDNIKKEVDVALKFSEYLLDSDYISIGKLKDKIERLLPSSNGKITLTESNISSLFDKVTEHYSSVNIRRYRKIANLEIKKLRQINIFVGENNSGKTSLLEAVYLLAQLNDLNAFLELERFRGKFFNAFNAKWIDKNFISPIEVQGIFNNFETKIVISNDETNEIIDKSSYISTINIEASANDSLLNSYVHLYANKDPELYYQKAQKLCQSAFSSPYRYNDSILKKAHAQAVKNKKIDDIILFIRENIDATIEKIELIDIHGENRFFVTSNEHNCSIDLTKYGEGLQRIFEIALLITYCSDGILCIDEVDSAIHKKLLVDFARFVQKLADRYNVQIFLSTHSKECIDAFTEISNNDKMMAFILKKTNEDVGFQYIEGDKLKNLVNSINLDIR